MKKIDNDAIDRELREAFDAYKRGQEVLITDSNREVLHRTEYPKKITERPDFLEILAATQTARGTFIVHDVPAEYWNNSHWPQTLKAANEAYLHRRFVTGRSAQSDS